MANEVLGGCIDIHASGEGLRFPHHTNQLTLADVYLLCSMVLPVTNMYCMRRVAY